MLTNLSHKYKKIFLLIILSFILPKISSAAPDVYIADVNPFIRFWVTTDPYSNTPTTTLGVKDYEVLDILKNLYRETLRNNFWLMDKFGIKAEKDQGLEKAKIQTLTNELDQEFINWVNYGFNNGNSAYIKNMNYFNKRISNRITNDYIETLKKMFPDDAETTPFFMKYIMKILARKISIKIDTEENNKEIISWDEWKNKESSMNPSLVFSSLKALLNNTISEAKNSYISELTSGNGFLSYKKCDVSYADVKGNISQDSKNVITFYGDLNYYSGNLWDDTQEGKQYEGKRPIVSCIVLTPGSVISDKLNSINTSKDEILRMNAALTNGKDSLLDGIKEELETYQTQVLSKGIFSITASDTEKINKKIKENSEILASSTGGNLKIDEDLSNPRNKKSPYYPGKILTDKEWEKIWKKENSSRTSMSEEEKIIITDTPDWYNKDNYLFGEDWDKWNVLNVFEPKEE